MKNMTRFSFLAAAVAVTSALSFSALAATATGTANATVLTPIAISAGTALNFGTLAGNATGGTVIVTAAGVRTPTGSVVVTGAAFTAGTFTVTGTGASTFAVTYPASFNVTSGANTMGVVVTGAAIGTLSGGTVSLPVGGTLTVGGNQAAGSYTGTYTMTVEYN
ncbi:DUF4402 domain-containing protein [Polaromonas eurypsychrophila]|uniref:DUF4402 domain-containing protein n=1 Tax=Polaromonas eurypsychrophila TaxID=1614635 RepID=A0A916WM83_9BURK|nr:DUF4402 domain-containing protein [Polaromonas eurypsychrophila]GGB13754.1 hypothetical protein GCM10011496_38380 [Polaromonas eurypsychrophila]